MLELLLHDCACAAAGGFLILSWWQPMRSSQRPNRVWLIASAKRDPAITCSRPNRRRTPQVAPATSASRQWRPARVTVCSLTLDGLASRSWHAFSKCDRSHSYAVVYSHASAGCRFHPDHWTPAILGELVPKSSPYSVRARALAVAAPMDVFLTVGPARSRWS
jgi:hypothetical protein